ncbi:MAG: hypothetical protein KC912_14070 [Proteobacteria bacterium]|nr:hypothetical protein [Pseudomonadota bacterium]
MTRHPASRPWARRLLVAAGLLAAFLVLAVGGLALSLHQPRPATGQQGEVADAFAHRIEAATGQQAWKELGAVQWRFADANDHLWDRSRELDRVRYDGVEVLLHVHDATGVATRNGQPLDGDDTSEALSKAQKLFYNDSYWLNPFSKLFDPGVTRSIIETDRGEALLVEFSSGGSTPGDAFAIYVDADGLPVYWEMWVSILPLGGVGTSWEGWQDLGGGALSATLHRVGPITFELTDVRAAGTLSELEEDPFAELRP